MATQTKRKLAITVLRLIWRVGMLVLGAIAALASDKRARPRYTASKAEQLYKDGAISGTEYARCIYGEE